MKMKKYLIAFLVAAVLVLPVLAGAKTLAGGDKVRGEKAEGDATQVCETPDYEGEDCPYGDYDPFE